MKLLHQVIACPHCGHPIRLEIDRSNGDQAYYDNCPACCQEVHINMHVNEVKHRIELQIDADDEQYY